MRALIVLPHRDATLELAAPSWHIFDAASAFLERLTRPDALARYETPSECATPEAARALLLGRAGASLLARGARRSLHRGLRALGAALAAASAPPSSVRLRIDDLELASGTTERGADVLTAAAGQLPYEPELARAVELVAGAAEVCLWIDGDQQLPAAAFIAHRLPAHQRLTLGGAFARTHAAALGRLAPFSRARVSDPDAVEQWLTAPPGLAVDVPRWRWRVPESPLPVADWAGWICESELTTPERLVASGCRGALLSFCAIDDEGVLTTGGNRVPWPVLAHARSVLGAAGAPLLGEWWVGAPGVSEASLRQTLTKVPGGPFDRVVGARAFHWRIDRTASSFGAVPVTRGVPEADRDLARSVPASAPGGISPEKLGPVLEACAEQLMQLGHSSAGRIAAAQLLPEQDADAGAALALNPDCAIVPLPATLEGAPRASWYAVNLKSGRVLALDARIAPSLAQRDQPAPRADWLMDVPGPQRDRLIEALVARRVLVEVRG